MKVNGNILLEQSGAFPNVHKHNIKYAVLDFALMVKEATISKDTLYYDSEEWGKFYAYGYNPTDDYWKGLGSIAYELLFNISNPLFKAYPIGESKDFNNMPLPRTSGGFMCDGCPTSNYIYSKPTIDKWHNQWFKDNPNRIDWSEFKHDIWARYDITVAILREELENNKEKLEKGNVAIPHKDYEVVNVFHDYVMNHKSEVERISYAKVIGSKICEANYYHREIELENLEANHGNNHAEMIYSIKKNGEYIFLCVDKQHGMFERCDDKGNHVEEIRFDGSHNTGKETSHSLQCVAEWKRIYNK